MINIVTILAVVTALAVSASATVAWPVPIARSTRLSSKIRTLPMCPWARGVGFPLPIGSAIRTMGEPQGSILV